MLDPVFVLEALGAAGLTAAAVLLLYGWPWRNPFAPGAAAGGALGVGLGVYVGVFLLGLRPHWPPREDQDRLLFLLLPAVVVVEFVAAFAGRFRGIAWLPRLIIAAGAVRLLLHESSFITDLDGPGSREWPPAQTSLILGGLAAALAVVWALLTLLLTRVPGRAVPFAVALSCAGAGVTVMLSGYASGGQIGLALSASLIGAAVASLALKTSSLDLKGVLGIGVVGLFALLVVGRFFGELTTTNAALLFLGLLLAWLPELPYVRRLWPWLRGLLRVVLVLVPVLVALTLAYGKYVENSKGPAGSPDAFGDEYK